MSGNRIARWAGYVAFAIVFAVACGFLSNWQFSRSAERNAELALIAANYDADAAPLDELVTADGALSPEDEWRQVELVGTYLHADQLLVRNRPHGGTSAFEVLVPFRLEDGRVVIVDRGWVAPGKEQPEPDVIPAAPEGTTTVVVRLRETEPLPSSGRSAPDGQVPTIHVPTIAETIEEPTTLTGLYGLMVAEQPAPAERPQALDRPSDDPGSHLSYAIQWILFAVMGFGFVWYMIRTERRHRREEAEGRAPSEPKRRRDRDMQEEDELLDSVR
ncbi:SURF1 family cytochrome oxidase biogenesis protein [Microbacterium sp. bgisy189]|uniref:SURF1 family cytochrome oxidase biogenesis protein n=1 Tax=Microbacterium sp. bgisy189 TaxID=3413798 RepID=UPI003EBA1096